MMNRIGRHLREGMRNVLRNGWMTFASVSAVMVTLAVLGFSLVLAMNAQQMSKDVESQVEFSAFLDASASQKTGVQVANEIRQMPGVASVQVISKAEGLSQFEGEFGDYKDVLKQLNQNPLPIQLVVKASKPQDTVHVANEVKQISEIKKISDAQQVVGSLFKTLNMLRNIGLVFVIALLITSMFLISNTIRITIFSRRREIEIMKLVGATNGFIRWPFVIEGMLIGFFGSLVPLAVIGYGYNTLYTHAHGSFQVLGFALVSSGMLVGRLAVVLIAIGVFIGIWGGVMSVRKFLRV
ncbi:permease-like cell division protein FtsX [Alicyclobacillus fodiniaquatilis]|uniref:Cell division protein FtsX n=1 Tax=Alicyclobacillus fodiniaquatilis TaxID=1661150 RepID=A0ABW4JRH6_9BACL